MIALLRKMRIMLPVFSWGAANLTNEGEARAAYLKAVKAADQGDYSLLLAFARS